MSEKKMSFRDALKHTTDAQTLFTKSHGSPSMYLEAVAEALSIQVEEEEKESYIPKISEYQGQRLRLNDED